MEPNKILSANVLDLLFEDRNKEYGAYDLRTNYNKRIARALLITSAVAITLTGSIFLSKKLSANSAQIDIPVVVLVEIPTDKIEKVIEPPRDQPRREEVRSIQHTPPDIVPDHQVPPDQRPPDNDDLANAKIDVVTTDGIEDDGIIKPADIDDGREIIIDKKPDNEPLVFVQIEAKFEGDWVRFLERNLNSTTPVDNGAPEGDYPVMIQFVVDVDGSISNIKPLTSHGYGMEEEAIRVIKKAPKWTPAFNNGIYVKAYRKQKITFRVTTDE